MEVNSAMIDRRHAHPVRGARVIRIAAALSFSLAWLDAAAAPPIEPIDTEASCMESCHQEFGTQAYVHKPAKTGTRCTDCHKPTEANRHAFQPTPKQSAEQCIDCHDKELYQGKVVHGPVAEGQCTDCHDPHQSEFAGLLKQDPPEQCFACHDSALRDPQGHLLPATKHVFESKQAVRHPPFARGECSECHLPHVSASPRLLSEDYPDGSYARYDAYPYKLCFSCHVITAFADPRTLSDTRFRNGNLNLHHRHVNRDKGRTCGTCHAAHGSTQERLVIEEFRFGNRTLPVQFATTENGGSCTSSCHSPVKYDRCQPEPVTLRTTPRQGSDATAEELRLACKTEPEKARSWEEPGL